MLVYQSFLISLSHSMSICDNIKSSWNSIGIKHETVLFYYFEEGKGEYKIKFMF